MITWLRTLRRWLTEQKVEVVDKNDTEELDRLSMEQRIHWMMEH